MPAASPASALTPGADPSVSFSLMTIQQDLVNVRQEPTKWNPPRPLSRGRTNSGQLPEIGLAAEAFRWGADIRIENAVTELMQPIRMSTEIEFGAPPDPNTKSNNVVFCVAHDSDRWPIFKVSRPPHACFVEQLNSVHQHIDLRPERLTEIINQIGIPMQFWATILDINPVDHHYTLELLAIALQGLSHVNQFAKHTLACPRPAAYSPSIQPVINPRRFGAFPSGHAAEAFLIARLLQVLSGQARKPKVGAEPNEYRLELHLQRLAARIADNRVVAGVHFPIDGTAGRMVGETFAEYFLFRCGLSPHSIGWTPRRFDGSKLAVNKNADDKNKYLTRFDPFEPLPGPDWEGDVPPYFSALPATGVGGLPKQYSIMGARTVGDNKSGHFDASSILAAVANRARAEWNLHTDWEADFGSTGGGN